VDAAPHGLGQNEEDASPRGPGQNGEGASWWSGGPVILGMGVWAVTLTEGLWQRGSNMEGCKGTAAEVLESGSGGDRHM
jgi:hypothetical protein